jgi:hypothetical protein
VTQPRAGFPFFLEVSEDHAGAGFAVTQTRFGAIDSNRLTPTITPRLRMSQPGRGPAARAFTSRRGRRRLFPTTDDYRSAADKLRNFAKATDFGKDEDKPWVPPLAMMATAGVTHTQAPLPPPTAPYEPNDNWVLSPVSGFWGGAVSRVRRRPWIMKMPRVWKTRGKSLTNESPMRGLPSIPQFDC